jgi:hypothetical protein
MALINPLNLLQVAAAFPTDQNCSIARDLRRGASSQPPPRLLCRLFNQCPPFLLPTVPGAVKELTVVA